MQLNGKASTAPHLALNLDRLDELRKAHGIETETDLAKVIGVNPATLFRIRKGDVTPSSTFIARVALAFPSAPLSSLVVVAGELS